MGIEFSESNQREIARLIERYPNRQAALLPVLWVAQRQFGWISEEVMQLVAKTLDVSPAHVYGVVTFYTLFNREPVGKYHLQLCRTLSCAMMGGESLLKYLKERLEIGEGETTADGKFTLSLVECLASCGTAPTMMINEKYYENLTPEKVDQILEGLK